VYSADDGQRNWPKRVEFYSKNKCEKLMHLVGFVVRMYHSLSFKHLIGRLHRNRSIARPVRERSSGLGSEDGIGTVHPASGLAKVASEINVLKNAAIT